jgi:hypothetical protein
MPDVNHDGGYRSGVFPAFSFASTTPGDPVLVRDELAKLWLHPPIRDNPCRS